MTVQVTRGNDATGGAWEAAVRPARTRLAEGAQALRGYEERTAGRLLRREGPIARVVVIVDLGPGLWVASDPEAPRYQHYRTGFVAGLTDRAALVEHRGLQRGVQLDLSPTVARRLFGVPSSELAGRVVDLDDLLPRGARDLAARVKSREGWAERLDEVDGTLGSLITEDRDVGHRVVEWAVGRILASGGRVSVATLAEDSGYSHKHLTRLFRDHAGLSPKRLARVARLEALRAGVERWPRASWAALAVACGFSDQSHLGREVRALTGLSPTAWRREMIPFGLAPPMSDSYQTSGRDSSTLLGP